ncbi:uncharacterized protein [Physcomitrium patens]|uniref:uncharacterized protein isoform X1 n=1 Tax=Physcomitrium patens TaxID=3218 RepID=UPI003CCE1FA4
MKAKPSGSATTKKPEEPKEVKSKTQTIELNIKLCCGNCVQNVRKALDDVKGLSSSLISLRNFTRWPLRSFFLLRGFGSLPAGNHLKKLQKVDKRATLVKKKQQN